MQRRPVQYAHYDRVYIYRWAIHRFLISKVRPNPAGREFNLYTCSALSVQGFKTLDSVASRVTATWHFTLQLARTLSLLSRAPFGWKSRLEESRLQFFLPFVEHAWVNRGVFWCNIVAASAFATKASKDDTLFFRNN